MMSYFDDHEIIEVIVKCRHATDEVVEFTGDDIVRCKECVSYCGDGVPCLWGLKTGEMGFCHHGYRGGDTITIAEQTEPQTRTDEDGHVWEYRNGNWWQLGKTEPQGDILIPPQHTGFVPPIKQTERNGE